jgi:HPt (histidine-containing phosphotransfer) domain-containing protein
MRTEIPIHKEIEPFVAFFLDSRAKEVITIEQLISEKSFQQLENIFHNLKGVSKSFGFPTLGTIAMELEKACVEKNITQTMALFTEFKSYLRKYSH